MLSQNEINQINLKLTQLKQSFFQLVSDFGPNYIGNYRMTFDEIKNISNRKRITDELVSDYIDYISYSGFIVDKNPIGLCLQITSRSMIGSPDDAESLANAIRTFRDRAVINGDLDNM
ncbi:TPA: hypothetical protein ACPDW5_002209 [Pasteurella multocida]